MTPNPDQTLPLRGDPDTPPPSHKWEDLKTRYLPGDLVETKFGLAVIREATGSNGERYSIWPLPGWKWLKHSWGWEPVVYAWYGPSELKLIEAGPASRRRPI